MSTHVLKVEPPSINQRLDLFLTQNLPDAPSRSFVQKLIESGYVSVNNSIVKSKYKITEGDTISVDVPEEFLAPENIEPENIPLNIFYEDDHLLVINKPIGMLVHPASGCNTGTLVNALLHHCQQLSDFNSPLRAGIVHRLDKETSGLIIVAKDNTTHAKLARQFQKHTIRKKYLALVEGQIEFDEGMVDVPLGRHEKHHDKKIVSFEESAKEALTYYKVIKRVKGTTLVALFPQTGRTHQLRVHMAYLKHPILGDSKYGKRDNFERLALHAQAIGFIHPFRACYLEFSTKPPKEFLERVK